MKKTNCNGKENSGSAILQTKPQELSIKSNSSKRGESIGLKCSLKIGLWRGIRQPTFIGPCYAPFNQYKNSIFMLAWNGDP